MIKSNIRFKVKYKFVLDGEEKKGIESEASWYLVDQQGNMYSYGPFQPVAPVDMCYTECEPLLKVNDEWLSIKEIEARLNGVGGE